MFDDEIKKIRALGIMGTIIGVALILVGIAGAFIPLVPQFIFIIAGLSILGVELAFLKKWEKLFRDRYMDNKRADSNKPAVKKSGSPKKKKY